MIAVTGAAGFIGSNIVWKLNRRAARTSSWSTCTPPTTGNANLAPLKYERYLTKDDFRGLAGRPGQRRAAWRPSTTWAPAAAPPRPTAAYLDENNFGYTRDLCLAVPGRRACASSTPAAPPPTATATRATTTTSPRLDELKPLNLYAKSKQDFDLWARDEGCSTRSSA